MRTTLNLNDDLLREAKKRAAESQRTLTAVIEDALRLSLQRSEIREGMKVPVQIPTSGEGGLLPGVDLDDTSALLDRMDGIE